MACRSCGAETPAGAKFCVECGAPQGAACPACGAQVTVDQRFCAECGHRLTDVPVAHPSTPTAPAAGSSPAPAGTERRLVTVLFADLVGFTTLAEGRDAEAVRDLLGRYFDVSREIARRYGGTVEKFIGDAVMAVWGTPVAHEDDAERAVRAGLELVEAVARLGSELGVADLRARAGLLTGEAAVNVGAIDQGMIAGDLVNTASRLQAAALPGTVLVGEATMQAASRAIAFEVAGEQDLKGKAVPVTAWRAVRVIGTVGGRGRSDPLEPPFVGRETEFRLLRELFHATGRDRRARLVSMTGQAGIGKSRLAWEFSKYTDGIAETVFWHEGRSPSYGEGVAFWALGEMIRKRAGLIESDDEATTREQLAEMLARYVPVAEERAFIEPAVLMLLGVGETPAGGRERLFAAWRTLFERIAEQGTVALVFEDLHWADDGLLDFLEHLLEWSRNHPIFVVTLARPELLDRRASWGAGHRNGTSLPLGPLSEAEMRSLLTGTVPGLPEPAIRTILARADGIPLYAVETIRMLVGDGRIAVDAGGRFHPVGDLGTLDVPSSLRGLIAARLDSLPPADRALVADGAVLGKTFTIEALASVAGMDVGPLEARLRELDRLEIVELDTDPRSPERGQYGFVQSLIREVAYGTLSRRDRRAKHLAAARHFESIGDEELAGALATHYLAAWEALPEGDEGAAVAGQARIALRSAGERALALGSPAQALTHFDQALGIPGSALADEAALLERAGDSARLAGRYDLAAERCAAAVTLRRDLGDHDALAGAIAGVGEARMRAGHVDDALATLTAGLAEVSDAAGLGLVALLDRLAQAHLRASQPGEALAVTERQLALAERLRLPEAVVDGMVNRTNVLTTVGRLMEAAALIQGARGLADGIGLPMQSLALLGQQVLLDTDEAPRRSIEAAREAAAMARRLGSTYHLVMVVLNGGEAAFHTGDWAWSRREYATVLALDLSASDRLLLTANARILDVLTGRRDPELEAGLATVLAVPDEGRLITFKRDLEFWPAWIAGDFDRCIDLQLDIVAADELNAPMAYERAVRAALWKGDRARARALYDELAGLGRRSNVASAALVGLEAGVLTVEGHGVGAEGRYRESIASFEDLGCDFEVAQVALDAVVLVGAGTSFGHEMVAVARPILERLEAGPYLDTLAALEAAVAEASPAKAAAAPPGASPDQA